MNPNAISESLSDWLPALSKARCARKEYDPDLWHDKSRTSFQTRLAMSICQVCPARQECLAWAVTHRPLVMGVWGGMWFKNYDKVRKTE